VGTALVDKGADGTLTSTSSFIVVRIMHSGETMLFASGVYRDRIVVDDDDKPQIAERIVVLDSQQIDTLLAIPL
jgi:3-phenylpropionate/cinnamic acid dioxygenase small subunit